MFKHNIEELYFYLTKEKLHSKYSCIKQKRKSSVLYDLKDYKWILIPDNIDIIQEEDLELFSKTEATNLMFINNSDINKHYESKLCRKLTETDRVLFEEFHNACSEEDKDEGMVSLDDPVVYGCFVDNKIVSVSSLWNWGEHLSDIGILTHPNYRHKGYSKDVCLALMSKTDKMFVWRCNERNIGSYKLAVSIGFKKVGKIYILKRV